MDKPKTTAKDFFLWAGAMIAFYWTVIAYTFLVFDYINYTFPNALSYYPADPYQSGISYEMASIIVLFPLYLLLMWLIHKDISRDSSRKEIWVRRWALILTLFVAGAAITVDLITLLTTFLNGEALTTAFLLKVLVIFLVAGGVFMHFIADLRGYWDMFPSRRQYVRIGVAVLAVVTIVSGFFIVGSPFQARLARFDEQKANDLSTIQFQLINYWQAKQKLPTMLATLNDPIVGFSVPNDPQTGAAYGYSITGALSFELCADFNAQGRAYQGADRVTAPAPFGGKGASQIDWNWQHGSGQMCFDRTIDPSFYPPLNAKVQP